MNIKSIFTFSTIFIIGFIFFGSEVVAQPMAEWGVSIGGEGPEWMGSVRQTKDEGYIVAGTYCSDGSINGNNDKHGYWIGKIDKAGNLEWQKVYGGTSWDFARDVQQTKDEGYIVAGNSSSQNGDVGGTHGDTDYWILKLDTAGDLEWKKNFGGTEGDFVGSMEITADDGYIIAGSSESNNVDVGANNGYHDFWIVKLDISGNLEWEKNYGGSSYDNATSTKQTPDGGYIVLGKTDSNDGDVGGNNGHSDIWLVKLDAVGNLEWEKNYGGTGFDHAAEIQVTPEGEYIIAGHSVSDYDYGIPGETDIWIIKLDITGNLEWERILGGTLTDKARSIGLTADGGYIIAGYSDSIDGDIGGNIGNDDYWIVKLNHKGDVIWENSYGGSNYDRPTSIRQTLDNGYIITGTSSSNDGDVAENNGYSDFWILKLAPVSTVVQNTNPSPAFSISPNPTNEEFTIYPQNLNERIAVKIVDSAGHIVYKKNGIIGPLKINNLVKGLYHVVLTDDKNSYAQKIIVQ